MKQVNAQNVQSGRLVRFARWIARMVDQHFDRLVAMRAYDDRRYDYTQSRK